MGDSDREDVGFKYGWESGHYDTTKWTYYVSKEEPMQFRTLGVVKKMLAEEGDRVYWYIAFENVQRTNQVFNNLQEAMAWVVACTMGEKP